MSSSNLSVIYTTNLTHDTHDHPYTITTKHDIICTCVLIFSVIGVLGNTLTLLAFQFAKIKKKYRIHKTWNHITVFIWNLALIDMLSALNMTLLYSFFVFHPKEINSYPLCIFIITTRDIFVLISAASIACIAIVTVLGITKNQLLQNYCDSSSKVNLVILFVWVVGFVGYIAKLFRINRILKNYDIEETFDCGSFFYHVNLSQITLYSEFTLHFIVLCILFVSYGIVTTYTTCMGSRVDAHREGNIPKYTQTTKVVLLICCTYVLQCIPYMVCRLFFKETLRMGFFIQFSWPQKISYIIYYTQFFPNIIIYVTRNKIYRDVYVYWLQNVYKTMKNTGMKMLSSDSTSRNQHRQQEANSSPLN